MDWAANVTTAFVTAGIGFYLGWRGFLLRERFNEKRQKRDKLRELLAGTVPDMWAFLNVSGLPLLETLPDTREGKARELHREADKYIPFFPNDEDVQKAIRRMGNLVGSYADRQTNS